MEYDFTDYSDDVLKAMGNAKTQALKAIGFSAEGYAKKETPVDTGRLRNSIANEVEGDSVYIGTNVEYAPYIEFGARGRTAHHMLQRAATGHSEEYKEIAKRSFEAY